MFQKTATIYVQASEDVVWDCLEGTAAQVVSGNTGPGMKHELALSPMGTGTELRLTYSTPKLAWWNVAGRVVLAIGIRRHLDASLRLIKEEAERAAGWPTT